MDLPAAFATITAVSELTKAIVNGKIDDKVKAKASELNTSILALQGSLFELQSENHELLKLKSDLEHQLMELSNWEEEAKRYELHALCSGVFVYALKKEEQLTEPPHYLCPNCHQERRKSILQCLGTTYDGTTHRCPNPSCNAEFTNHDQYSSPPIV